MNLLDTVVQSLIQGLTEFLPVSSSGHLVLFQQFFHVQQPHMFMDIVLHLGTFLAVIIYFRKNLLELLLSFVRKPFDLHEPGTSYVWRIAVASLPTALIGLLIKRKFPFVYESVSWVLVFLFLTAVFLFVSDFIRVKEKRAESLSWLAVLFVGCAQGLAVLPGISRSGATIVAAILVGLARQDAGRFSFFIGLPAMLGAAVLEFKDVSFTVDHALILNATVAFLVSFIVALFSIRFLFFILKKAQFKLFSIYLVILVFAALILSKVLTI
jgi:undecaprenyl-diphosphatase